MEGLYEGFRVGKDNIHVPLLQYADETLIFCKFDDVMLGNLKKTLKFFNGVLGKRSIGISQPFVELSSTVNLLYGISIKLKSRKTPFDVPRFP